MEKYGQPGDQIPQRTRKDIHPEPLPNPNIRNDLEKYIKDVLYQRIRSLSPM